tara:strand:+ start:403 stop:636 length:234 start_codon:yes stop_codon:yes gene_type:complete
MLVHFTFPTNEEKLKIMLLTDKEVILNYINQVYENKYQKLLLVDNKEGIIECCSTFSKLKNARAKTQPVKIPKIKKK